MSDQETAVELHELMTSSRKELQPLLIAQRQDRENRTMRWD